MVRTSAARTGIGCLMLASLGSCDCCEPDWPDDVPPRIESVSIFPRPFSIVPDHEQEFEAVALSTEGDRFDPMDYDDEGYEIRWETTGPSAVVTTGAGTFSLPLGVSLDDDDGNPVVAMVTDPALPQFTLVVTVTYGGSETSDQVVIQVEGATPPPPADRVRVPPTPDLAGAVLNGCELTTTAGVDQRREEHWELFEVAELTPLGKNYTEDNCGRGAEFAVAAPFSRLILNDGTAATQSFLTGLTWTDPLWTDALGDELKAVDPAWWLLPDEVDLYVYNYTGKPKVEDAVKAQLDLANKVYGESRAGIRFNLAEFKDEPFADLPAQVTSCAASYVGGSTSVGGVGVDILSTRLNVVVFEGSLPQGGLGFTCPVFPAYPGRVLFLQWGDSQGIPLPATMAHELGHILGHDEPPLAFGWRHVGKATSGPFAGFTKSNLMHPKVNGVARDHLTIGQGFRMNVDLHSWYQKEPGIGNHHPARDCGIEPYCSDACPPLQRDVNEIPVSADLCSSSSATNGGSDR